MTHLHAVSTAGYPAWNNSLLLWCHYRSTRVPCDSSETRVLEQFVLLSTQQVVMKYRI